MYDRLQRYDFNVYNDCILSGGVNFAEQLKDAISNSVENGYVITLLTDSALKLEFVCAEIEYARRIGADKRILSVILTNQPTPIVNGTTIIRPRRENFGNPDAICDMVIQSLLSPGEILTYYRNFKRSNQNGDKYEAERLGKLYYEWAKKRDEMNSPSGVISLGLCYEEGIGVDIDLKKAYEQYHDPVATDGCAREMAKRVYSKLHPDSEKSIKI